MVMILFQTLHSFTVKVQLQSFCWFTFGWIKGWRCHCVYAVKERQMCGQCISCYAKGKCRSRYIDRNDEWIGEELWFWEVFWFFLFKKECVREMKTFMVGVCLGLHLRTDIEKMKMCLTRWNHPWLKRFVVWLFLDGMSDMLKQIKLGSYQE